jgi:predicted nucleotidyltransferase
MIGALFSTTQQRTLGLLFGQPDRSFFANEIIGLTGSGSGAVQRELGRLVESGLVTVRRVANQKHFQANHAAPLFDELRSIVRKTVGLAGPLSAALTPLAAKIRLAILYGSVAKRTDTVDSDVDLLIVGDDLTLEEAFAALAPAEAALSRKISVGLYSPEEFRRRRKQADSFISRVMRGEHLVLLGDENGLAVP